MIDDSTPRSILPDPYDAEVSKRKCPVCGGNKWFPAYTQDAAEGVVDIFFHGEVPLIVDGGFGTTDDLDFCSDCGTGITTAANDE